MIDILIAIAKVVAVVLLFAFPIGSLMTLLGDRKQSSLIQNRVGPNRARLPFLNHPLVGIPHFIADGLKMLFKEDIIPEGADRFWHNVSPALTLFPAIALWAPIPFNDLVCVGDMSVGFVSLGEAAYDANPLFAGGIYRDICAGELKNYFSISNLDSGILYVFALSAVAVYGAVLAGWASNSKYSLLGGLRTSAQMISYEVSMGLSITGLFMIYGTLNLNEMVQMQGHQLFGWLPMWGILVQPLSFFLFLTTMMAETKRAPFNVPEAESELVAGYFTEFSSMKFGVIQLGEYVATVFVGALIASLFLGGWQVPWLYADGFHFGTDGQVDIALPYALVMALRLGSMVIKTLFILWLQFMVRWTLPMFRYDQIMDLGWKFILPLSLLNLFVTGFIIYVVL